MTAIEQTETAAFADLSRLFEPRSVAVIGASADGNKISGRPIRFLERAGFRGSVHPVNPKYETIMGLPCRPSVTAVPEPVDLALIFVPGPAVSAAVDDCVAAGVPLAIVFSAGFGETGRAGRLHQEELVARARAGGMRLLGPNSLGVASVRNGLVASFATLFDRRELPPPGRVGLVSQSGALGAYMYALAQDQGVGFSRFVATGNTADLDLPDVIAYLADDDETDAIGVYLEGITEGERLLEALGRAQAAGKPTAILKVGRSEAGQRAAESHTGALAGSDAVFDAALRRSGAVRVPDPQALIDFLSLNTGDQPPMTGGLAVLSGSGGAAVWTADRFADFGLELAQLTPETEARLADALPAFASPRNPVDATAQMLNDASLFQTCLDVILADPGVGTLVILSGLQERDGERYAQQIVKGARHAGGKRVAVAWLAAPESVTTLLGRERIPMFGDLARCVGAVAASLIADQRRRAPRPADQARLLDPNTHLGSLDTEHSAKHLLASLGLETPRGALCSTREEVIAAASSIGGRVVLKGQVVGVAHKSDHGLVCVDVEGEGPVGDAFDALQAAMGEVAGPESNQGVLVEELLPEGLDLVVGCVRDPAFGPVTMIGLGGTLVELLNVVDFVVGEVDVDEAFAQLGAVRWAALFEGFRGGPPYDRRATAEAVSLLSRVATQHVDQIAEIEINPLRVLADGRVVALDALVVPTDG